MPSDKVIIGDDPIELDVMKHYGTNDEGKISRSGAWQPKQRFA